MLDEFIINQTDDGKSRVNWMRIFKRIFDMRSNSDQEPHERIRLTEKNIDQWPTYDKLLRDGKTKFDGQGRLRYLHGAPVGDLVLTGTDKEGT